MQARRRTAIALVLSLGLHAALLIWAVRSDTPAPAPQRQEQSAPAQEPITWLDADDFTLPPQVSHAQPRPVKPTSSVEQPQRPSRPVRPPPVAEQPDPSEPPQEALAQAEPEKSDQAPEPPPEAPGPDARPETLAQGDPAQTPGAPLEGPTAQTELAAAPPTEPGAPGSQDSPTTDGFAVEGPGLIPVIPGVGLPAEANPYASLSRGRTLRNGEGEAPDTEALAAMNGEKARRRVQAFAIDELAAARVRGGVVDGYFGDMKRVLQKNTENPPRFTEGATFVHDLLTAWAPGASQYAATGNPYGQGKVGEGSRERDMQDPVASAAAVPGSAAAEVHARRAATDRLREFADGRFGDGIVALVEIRQTREGAFQDANLVRSSGNRLFDQHVMKTAPEAIAKVPPAPSQGVGLHRDGIRTVWAFEGRVIFKHKVKKDQLTARDWAGLAGMQALSALTNNWVPGSLGSFDETTGEMEIIDLTKPRFICNVRLLRIY